MKKKLDFLGDLRVRMGGHNGSGNSLRHLQGKTRPRQRRRRGLRHGCAQNAGHRQPRLIFNALGHAHRNSPEPGKARRDFAQEFRGHRHHRALACPPPPRARSGSYFSCGDSGMPGKKTSLRPVRCTSRRWAGSCPQSVTSLPFWQSRLARAVPQAPAPMTVDFHGDGWFVFGVRRDFPFRPAGAGYWPCVYIWPTRPGLS